MQDFFGGIFHDGSENATMKIAIVAGECNHFLVHTGLASYVRDLGRALKIMGVDARVVIPYFGCVDQPDDHQPEMMREISVDWGTVTFWELGDEQLPVYALAIDRVRDAFNRLRYTEASPDRINWGAELMGNGEFREPDMAEAMIEFNRVAAEWLLDEGQEWRPDIIHCVNWEAALLPSWVRTLRGDSGNDTPRMVLTVDLLTCQGIVTQSGLVPGEIAGPDAPLNFMQQGIVESDVLHLPSQYWADELCDANSIHAAGLEDLLQAARERNELRVVPFAINAGTFDPRRNPAGWNGPPDAASRPLRELKDCAKTLLQEELNLNPSKGPLFLAGNRLDPQKGYDAIRSVFPGFLQRHAEAQLILRTLSPPDPDDKRSWKARMFRELLQLEEWFPGRVVVNPPGGYEGRPDINWLRLLLAADVSLLPSYFEPCGLNHRQSLRIGTPVIASRKGDMAVTITPANGWLFDSPNDPASFRWCLEDAFAAYGHPDRWAQMVRNAQNTPVGWEAVIQDYDALYR